MNYRHAFHAGNFADVFKHVLLTRILLYLLRKDGALRYLDTHAGVGRYDLAGDEAGRTGEWREGVGRIVGAPAPAEIAGLLAPWLAAVGPVNPEGMPMSYPGSPAIAQTLLRSQDRLTLCELHADDAQALAANMGRDRRLKVLRMDGYTALRAYVPPVERRGLVLVDPPFEAFDEFDRMTKSCLEAWRKWPTGVYALWHPIKDEAAVDLLHERLRAAGVSRLLRLELSLARPQRDGRLVGSGLAVINPPHVLADEARLLLPWLAERMGAAPGSRVRVDENPV
ncbi:MAG: Ribosomal large subunit methyltransferase [Hyphomicrobiales bacterium]|nr:Ribosomal large subunit methyltransferase [Hyphomicrobiales bacterium]